MNAADDASTKRASPDEFPWFDALRGIAALMVFTYHVGGAYGGLVSPESDIRSLVGRLEVALPIFFVISGFLLWRPFVVARSRGRRLSVRRYAARRGLRLVPAYWVALTVITLVLGLEAVREDPLIYYGFLQIYDADTVTRGIPQAWSLCIEITFYAMLPVLAWLLTRLPARGGRQWLTTELGALAACFAFSVTWKVVALLQWDTPIPNDPQRSLSTMPSYLDQLSLGMLLAVVSVWIARRGSIPRALAPLSRFPGIAWAGAAAAYLFTVYGIGLTGANLEAHPPGEYLARHELYGLIALLLVVPAAIGDQRQGFIRRRILANRFLLYMGVISYSFYIYHVAAGELLNRWGLGNVEAVPLLLRWYVPAFVLTFLVASASFWLVERPAMRLRLRIGRDAARGRQDYETAREAQEEITGGRAVDVAERAGEQLPQRASGS